MSFDGTSNIVGVFFYLVYLVIKESNLTSILLNILVKLNKYGKRFQPW